MEAIVISGMPASGKTTLAHSLGERLGVPVLGGNNILEEMAIERGYKPTGDEWWDSGEGLRFLGERRSNPEFDKETDRRMKEKIKRGNIVVTSWTAPWLVEEGFKVWISATRETRAERMAERDGTSVEEAEQTLLKRDSENHELYSRLYGIDYGNDMKPFDLIVRNDGKEASETLEIVIKAFEERDKHDTIGNR